MIPHPHSSPPSQRSCSQRPRVRLGLASPAIHVSPTSVPFRAHPRLPATASEHINGLHPPLLFHIACSATSRYPLAFVRQSVVCICHIPTAPKIPPPHAQGRGGRASLKGGVLTPCVAFRLVVVSLWVLIPPPLPHWS